MVMRKVTGSMIPVTKGIIVSSNSRKRSQVILVFCTVAGDVIITWWQVEIDN